MKKSLKITYWVSTIWLCLGMVSTGIVQLMQNADELKRMDTLNYPYYLLYIIGIWKILGVITVLAPKFLLLKEWAYAGFFFAMSGAIVSHIFSNSRIVEILPSMLLLLLTIVSWKFRPEDRKIIITQ